MPGKNKSMSDLLNKKSPNTLRSVPIQPVQIIEEATRVSRPDTPVELPNEEEEVETSSVEANQEEEPISSSFEAVVETDVESDELEVSEAPNAIVNNKDENKTRISKERGKTVRNTRTVSRTKKPKLYSERDITALLASDKRRTERYSFEIFSDQKEDIQTICDLYEDRVGEKLSASRLIREVLDSFIPGALNAFSGEE